MSKITRRFLGECFRLLGSIVKLVSNSYLGHICHLWNAIQLWLNRRSIIFGTYLSPCMKNLNPISFRINCTQTNKRSCRQASYNDFAVFQTPRKYISVWWESPLLYQTSSVNSVEYILAKRRRHCYCNQSACATCFPSLCSLLSSV